MPPYPTVPPVPETPIPPEPTLPPVTEPPLNLPITRPRLGARKRVYKWSPTRRAWVPRDGPPPARPSELVLPRGVPVDEWQAFKASGMSKDQWLASKKDASGPSSSE